ncbi:hypothetical protein BX666DRAFT_1966570 [Dichotomocladium elegans]|nr:hypothetical protein BX666DRAFT_1966570 [Dichotomocladium elegans]
MCASLSLRFVLVIGTLVMSHSPSPSPADSPGILYAMAIPFCKDKRPLFCYFLACNASTTWIFPKPIMSSLRKKKKLVVRQARKMAIHFFHFPTLPSKHPSPGRLGGIIGNENSACNPRLFALTTKDTYI